MLDELEDEDGLPTDEVREAIKMSLGSAGAANISNTAKADNMPQPEPRQTASALVLAFFVGFPGRMRPVLPRL